MKYDCICQACKYKNEKWNGEHCFTCEYKYNQNFVPIGQEEEDPYQADMDEAWNQVKAELESGFYHTEREEMTNKEAIEEIGAFYECGHLPKEEAIKMAIKALSQEPCGDTISRIIKEMWNWRGKHTTSIDKVKMEQIIRDELPSVTPAERTGHWFSDIRNEYFICNQCHAEFERYSEGGCELIDEYNYCPNCGARMKEGEE